jgi:hypothetical protein
MKNRTEKLLNFNLDACLAGLFGRDLGFKGSSIIAGICFFFALFLIGNPYLSLGIMVVCFVFLCWNFFRLIQTDLSFLNILVLTSIGSFLYIISGEFIFFFYLQLKLQYFCYY